MIENADNPSAAMTVVWKCGFCIRSCLRNHKIAQEAGMKNKRFRELAAILVMMTMTAGSITTVAAETDAIWAMSMIVAKEIKSFLINNNLSQVNFILFFVSSIYQNIYYIIICYFCRKKFYKRHRFLNFKSMPFILYSYYTYL